PRLVAETTDSGDAAEAAAALGTDDNSVAVFRSPIAAFDNGITVVLVPLGSLAAVRALAPNPEAITRFSRRYGATTFMAFTTETLAEEAHAHCRVFAPEAGVYEDAATGSANGPLGAYLVRYGLADAGVILSEQGYEMGRPSRLEITIGRGSGGDVDDVRVAGGVHITGEGTLFP